MNINILQIRKQIEKELNYVSFYYVIKEKLNGNLTFIVSEEGEKVDKIESLISIFSNTDNNNISVTFSVSIGTDEDKEICYSNKFIATDTWQKDISFNKHISEFIKIVREKERAIIEINYELNEFLKVCRIEGIDYNKFIIIK